MQSNEHSHGAAAHGADRLILGVRFQTGDVAALLERTRAGGLIVVPSAPVLVRMTEDAAHREALERADFAIADSGFMVLLWRLFTGESLPRISGLRYLRALLEWDEFRAPGASFWVMPSAEDAAANRAWLAGQGITVADEDVYVAPFYPPAGPVSDPALLARIQARRPRFVVICLGGGVQERVGFFLREALKKSRKPETGNLRPETGNLKPEGGNLRPETGNLKPETGDLRSESGNLRPESGNLRAETGDLTLNGELRTPNVSAAAWRPALICTGAAIAFLSNRQVNIPPWADRWMLGWLFRILKEPAKFLPRYWGSLRLVALLWREARVARR